MSRTAFVTGGTGFLGWHIIDQLLNQGWEVTALHRESSDLTYLNRFPARKVVGEITDIETLRKTIPEGIDAVFHGAADTAMWRGHRNRQTRTNVEGTRNMARVALEKGAGRFIHTSSISAYGRQGRYVDEDTPSVSPTSPVNYERTKWLAEQEVRAGIDKGLDAVILNPTGIIGPGDRNNWARSLFMVRDGKVPGVPPGGSPFCDVREVARMHLVAFEKAPTGANYLLGGETVPYSALFEELSKLTGQSKKMRPLPGFVIKTVGGLNGAISRLTGKEPDITPELARLMSSTMRCSSEKAQRELGYRDCDWRQSLRDTLDWLMEEGLFTHA